MVLGFIIFCFVGLTDFSHSEEGDCSSITPNTYEVVDTGFGVKYCFNAGKFLLLNKESKNKLFSYNLKNFKNSYLHSFGEISNEQLNKFDEEFVKISPHAIHFDDSGSLLVHLIYNHFHPENIDTTLIFVKNSPVDTSKINKMISQNIDQVCDSQKNELAQKGYIFSDCSIIKIENDKIIGLKIVGDYNDKVSQETKNFIQSRLKDFKIIYLKSRIIRYDFYYSFRNKNYFLNIISTCNEYMPKRSCEDEDDQLGNLVSNLTFTKE